MHNWLVNSNFETASKAAADFLAENILQTVKLKETCHVILPGGNTPAKCLEYLSLKDLPWEKIHWYPGDERVLPVGDAERNDVMINKNLLSRISAGIFHPIPAELGAEKAAGVYREQIKDLKKIDIAFLGMGEDGHTASLFPANAALTDQRSVIPVYHSPKPPAERVSFSLTMLQNAGVRMVLACGESKSAIIADIKNDSPLPINSIGDIYWFVDQSAVA